jgi:transcriptional regulator with XRE-family HTH domain
MFGQRLTKIREARGLNQSELARLCGVTSQAINQLEHRKWGPRLSTAENLAAALDCTVNDLTAALDAPIPDKPAPADAQLEAVA